MKKSVIITASVAAAIILAIVIVFASFACANESVPLEDRMYNFLNGLEDNYFSITQLEYEKGKNEYDSVVPLKLNDFTTDEYLEHVYEMWERSDKRGFSSIPQEHIDKTVSNAKELAKDNENYVTLIFSKDGKIVRKESIDSRKISFDKILGMNFFGAYLFIDEEVVNDDGSICYVLRATASP